MMIKIRIQGLSYEEVKEASEVIEQQTKYKIIYQSGVLASGDGYNRYYKLEKKDGEIDGNKNKKG